MTKSIEHKRRKERLDTYGVITKFKPHFIDDLPNDCKAKRYLRRLHKRLVADAGIDSTMKDIIAQRAAFTALQLETMEAVALKSGKIDPGVHTQMTNCLTGLLKSLGLEKKVHKSGGLKAYVRKVG
jgi:hypothetical protein